VSIGAQHSIGSSRSATADLFYGRLVVRAKYDYVFVYLFHYIGGF
jgi:hypothetical protein